MTLKCYPSTKIFHWHIYLIYHIESMLKSSYWLIHLHIKEYIFKKLYYTRIYSRWSIINIKQLVTIDHWMYTWKHNTIENNTTQEGTNTRKIFKEWTIFVLYDIWYTKYYFDILNNSYWNKKIVLWFNERHQFQFLSSFLPPNLLSPINYFKIKHNTTRFILFNSLLFNRSNTLISVWY